MNNVILIGRLTRDPEIKYVGQSNHIKVEFSIAVDRNYISKDGARGVDFIPIEAWNNLAEFASSFLHKGDRVGIEGRILIEKYINKEGKNRTISKVKVDNFKLLETKKQKLNNNCFDGNTTFENLQNNDENIEQLLPF